MKKQCIFLLLIFISIPGFSQYKTMRFIIRDKYDEKPIGGVVVRPNLLGDSVRSDEKGILRLKIASNFFDTLRFFSADYYPYALKVKKGMAYKTWFILMNSRSFPFNTLMNYGEVRMSQTEKDFKLVDGYIFHANLKDPMGKVAVSLDTGKVVAYSNSRGYYAVKLPKTVDSLVLFFPGFQIKKVPAYSRTLYNVIIPDSLSRKDIFDEQFKNVLSISLLELFQGGIALRYERFLKQNHSIGLLTAVYFFNRSSVYYPYYQESESMFGVTGEKFNGVKFSPFYRYYVFRNHKNGGYVEAKIPFGYFSFPSLTYRYSGGDGYFYTVDDTFSFWNIGAGIAWGNTFTKDNFFFNISQGIQFFGFKDPGKYIYDFGIYIEGEVEMEPVTKWWYVRGAGAILDLKVSIGWIF